MAYNIPMPIWKRYKGKKVLPNSPDWNKATWIAEGRIHGKIYKKSLRFAQTEEEAKELEFAIVRELSGFSVESVVKSVKINGSAFKHPYLYILESSGFYKIGHTNDIARRVKSIAATIIPFETRLMFAVLHNRAARMERDLHEKFKHRRVKGEWFVLDRKEWKELKEFLIDNLIPDTNQTPTPILEVP